MSFIKKSGKSIQILLLSLPSHSEQRTGKHITLGNWTGSLEESESKGENAREATPQPQRRCDCSNNKKKSRYTKLESLRAESDEVVRQIWEDRQNKVSSPEEFRGSMNTCFCHRPESEKSDRERRCESKNVHSCSSTLLQRKTNTEYNRRRKVSENRETGLLLFVWKCKVFNYDEILIIHILDTSHLNIKQMFQV